jgi:hypothetical protein
MRFLSGAAMTRILTAPRFWMTVYFAIGLVCAGLFWGHTAKDLGDSYGGRCLVLNRIFMYSAASGNPAEGIVVTTLFWPAVLIAGFTATCK